MNYILDTHTLLWFLEGNNVLSEKARECIENSQSNKFISIASIWEIAIKLSLGKLHIEIKFDALHTELMNNGFQILPVIFEHLVELSKLPITHRDPFDRIIISQAIFEKFTIITKDANFKLYKKLKIAW